jgi:HEAT repeat protein
MRPEFCSLEEACRLALHIARIDPNVEFKLVNRIRPEDRRPASVERTIRILTVLERISSGSGILVRIIKFSRHPDPKVRQLATRLIVRGQGDCRWASNLLADPDAAVRVSGIEEIARLVVKDAERILTDALHDIHAEVRIAALAGLCRRRVDSAHERLQSYGIHADPRIRICAYRAMGRLELAHFLPFLQQRAREDVPGVRGEALLAAARLNHVVVATIGD